MKKFLNGVIGIFLLFNLTIRFGTIFNYPPYNVEIAGFLGAVVAACIFVVFWPRYLRYLLFIFGFSFFLFGFGAIDIQSRIFELIVTLVAASLFVINWRAPRLNPFQGSPGREIQQGKGGSRGASRLNPFQGSPEGEIQQGKGGRRVG